MADRRKVYPGQEVLEDDVLWSNRYSMIADGGVLAVALGAAPIIDGLACTPGSGLTVSVAAGSIFSLQAVDATAYSSLASDSHTIVKQGRMADPVTLSCPAPGTGGQSINYLVQVGFLETDSDSTVLPYYNSANPTVPYSGPNNDGTANTTTRADQCVVTVKAGTAAATGTQTTPAPDAGKVGAWVVTVANGAVSIVTGNIVQYATAPFLTYKLNDIPRAAGFALVDTGALNALVVTPFPALTSYGFGQRLWVQIANTNTGAFTVAVNGMAARAVKCLDGTTPASGMAPVGTILSLIDNGTNYTWLNSPTGPTPGAADSSSWLANTAWVTARFNLLNLGIHTTAANVPTPLSLSYWYRVDTRLGSFNLTLPPSPVDGQAIRISDEQGTFGTAPPTILRNGNTIMGLAEDMLLNVPGIDVLLVYNGSDWRLT